MVEEKTAKPPGARRSAEPKAETTAPALAARLPVLEYHDTEFKLGKAVQMTTAWFLDQMQWLSDNGFRTLTGAELVAFVRGEARPPARSFALRFDLGQPNHQNYREVIVPTLQRHGFHAIFFLLTNMVRDACADNFICWDQVREWEAAGVIEAGSHGVFHPDYQNLRPDARRQDARKSKELIEKNLGHPIRFFAYPFDSVPDRAAALLKPLGYELAFCGFRVERSVTFGDPSPYALPCYYPYSSEETFPAITGAKGLTFGELMLQACAPPP